MNDMHQHGMGTHNMMILGEKAVFLSHLPMFEGDHAFQVILEASFAGIGNNPQNVYAKDRQNNRQTKMYTLKPEEFLISDLFTSDPEHAPRKSFKAMEIVRGHLERKPRKTILRDVAVTVKRVVHHHQLPTVTKANQLEYILFGRGQELFLAHLITQPPDFDQVLSVEAVGHRFTDEDLTQEIRVLVPGRDNVPAKRIHENEQVAAEIQVRAGQDLRLQVQAAREFYFEEGELFANPTFDPTPEEVRAGF